MASTQNPKGEVERLIEKNQVARAAQLCRRHKINIRDFEGLSRAVEHLYDAARFQEILTLYKECGVFGPYSVQELLEGLAKKGNDAAVIKFANLEDNSEARKVVLSSLEKRLYLLTRKGALVKAVRACRKAGVSPSKCPQVTHLAETLYSKSQFQVILSAIYEGGEFGGYNPQHLLSKLAKANMPPAFLVNVYRFGLRDQFKLEIEQAIKWHRERGLNDAEAWEKKFASFEELPSKESTSKAQLSNRILELRPLDVKHKFNVDSNPLSPLKSVEDDPYIISYTARVKVEKATREHQQTLQLLEVELSNAGFSLSKSKLIDLMGEKKDSTYIFEIKSINESNERDQVRHAVSQLFEYRYLYDLPHAKMFLVFSREPFSNWLVDYLRNISIAVVWIDDNNVEGPDARELMGSF